MKTKNEKDPKNANDVRTDDAMKKDAPRKNFRLRTGIKAGPFEHGG
jgi:hypothetical protein